MKCCNCGEEFAIAGLMGCTEPPGNILRFAVAIAILGGIAVAIPSTVIRPIGFSLIGLALILIPFVYLARVFVVEEGQTKCPECGFKNRPSLWDQ